MRTRNYSFEQSLKNENINRKQNHLQAVRDIFEQKPKGTCPNFIDTQFLTCSHARLSS